MDKVGEKICIVGNAAAITGRGLGAQIDAHDCVMRFNAFELSPAISEDFGTRTTHHAFWWGDRDKFNFQPGVKGIVNGAPYGIAHPWPVYRAMECQLVPAAFYYDLQRRSGLNRGPTTGFLMIGWMLDQGYAVSIANFDFLKTGHYFDADHQHTRADHDAGREEECVMALAADGKINIL